MRSGVGGAVGDFVGELVAVQLVVLVPSSTKPSRHWQWKSSPLLTHWVVVESQPWLPPSHGCSVGRCVGSAVGISVGSKVGASVGASVSVGAKLGALVGSAVGAAVAAQLVELPGMDT